MADKYKKVLKKLRKAGSSGLTTKQMEKIKPFKGMDPDERDDLLLELLAMGLVYRKLHGFGDFQAADAIKITWHEQSQEVSLL